MAHLPMPKTRWGCGLGLHDHLHPHISSPCSVSRWWWVGYGLNSFQTFTSQLCTQVHTHTHTLRYYTHIYLTYVYSLLQCQVGQTHQVILIYIKISQHTLSRHYPSHTHAHSCEVSHAILSQINGGEATNPRTGLAQSHQMWMIAAHSFHYLPLSLCPPLTPRELIQLFGCAWLHGIVWVKVGCSSKASGVGQGVMFTDVHVYIPIYTHHIHAHTPHTHKHT